MSAGRLFHKVGAATLNARLPYTVRVRGTCSSGRDTDRNVAVDSLIRYRPTCTKFSVDSSSRFSFQRADKQTDKQTDATERYTHAGTYTAGVGNEM